LTIDPSEQHNVADLEPTRLRVLSDLLKKVRDAT
jgi:hypothetical protein